MTTGYKPTQIIFKYKEKQYSLIRQDESIRSSGVKKLESDLSEDFPQTTDVLKLHPISPICSQSNSTTHMNKGQPRKEWLNCEMFPLEWR